MYVCWMDITGSFWRPVTGSCEHSNEGANSIKYVGFPEQQLLSNNSGLFIMVVSYTCALQASNSALSNVSVFLSFV